jgi:mono/diheme cytochrome c family protein
MKRTNTLRLGIFACAIAASSVVVASDKGDKPDVGKREFENNCIACHGKDLKGGAYVDFLKVTPPDLTQLSKKNGGVFPFERVYMTIDGRQATKGHGTREMPIWGKDYQLRAAEYYMDVNYDPEAYVRARIFALIDYLNRMQAK